MTPLPRTRDEENLRPSIVASGGLHLAILLFLYFGLPHFYTPLPAPSMPIPFEIVELADITNTRLKEPDQPQPPPPPPAPEVKAVAQPPTPQAQPQPPAPAPPQPAKPDQVEAVLPKPAEKPKPPAPAKPQTDMLASVLKDVSKLKVAPAVKSDNQTQAKDQAKDQPKSMAPSLSSRLTISEEDALRRQVEQCWNPPIGARDAQNLVVEVQLNVNPDRTVQSAEVVDKSRMASDPYFRAAGESALRAIYNPKCSPLELPEDKYDQWKSIDFTFDPRDML